MCVALLLANIAGVVWVNVANHTIHAQIREMISIYENTGLPYDEFVSRIRESGLNHSISRGDGGTVVSISFTPSHYSNETLRVVYRDDSLVKKDYITPDSFIDPEKVVPGLAELLKSDSLFNFLDFAFLNSAVLFVLSVIGAVRPLAPVSREHAAVVALLLGMAAFVFALVSRSFALTIGWLLG